MKTCNWKKAAKSFLSILLVTSLLSSSVVFAFDFDGEGYSADEPGGDYSEGTGEVGESTGGQESEPPKGPGEEPGQPPEPNPGTSEGEEPSDGEEPPGDGEGSSPENEEIPPEDGQEVPGEPGKGGGADNGKNLVESQAGFELEDALVAVGDESFSLLDGVTARDVNGDPIEDIAVVDDGGFDVQIVDNYLVIYEAADPVSDEVYSASRTVKVAEPMRRRAAYDHMVNNFTDLKDAIEAGGTILVTGDIVLEDPIELHASTLQGFTLIGAVKPDGGKYTLTCAGPVNSHAFYLYNVPDDFRMENLILDGNGEALGAIYTRRSLTLVDVDIRNFNALYSGGAIDAKSDSFFNVALDIQGGSFTNNAAGQFGGAIYAEDATVTVADATFNGNTARRGGAIYIKNETLQISDTEFTGNIAEDGGAIYSDENTDIQIADTTFTENIANGGSIPSAPNPGGTGAGGAIHHTKGALELSGVSFLHNEAAKTGGGVSHNTGSLILDKSAQGNENLFQGNLTWDTGSYGNGGAISHGGGNFEMRHTKILENNSWLGSGIVSSNNSLDPYETIIEDSEISSNLGGGAYIVGHATLNNVVVEDNGNANTSFYGAGGLTLSSGEVEITNTKIAGNTGQDAGGIWLLANSILEIGAGTEISGNKAEHPVVSFGGGIYVDGSARLNILDGAVVSGNSAYGGGGIFVSANGQVAMDGGQVSGNQATTGGGIYINLGGAVQIDGGQISGNRATKGGGIGVGGGTYVGDLVPYSNLKVGPAVVFSGNTADKFFQLSPVHKLLYLAQVEATVFSDGATYGYNNYDISYNFYTVTFDPRGGTMTDALQVAVVDGNILPKPANPGKPGAQFEGWHYIDENAQLKEWQFFADMVTSDITLYAVYDTTAVVFFDPNGGTMSNEERVQLVEMGEMILKPANPTPSGSLGFGGWYDQRTGGTQWNFSAPLQVKVLFLYAHWNNGGGDPGPQPTQYTVTFHSNGGTPVDAQSVKEGETANRPSTPTKSGFVFDNWYTDNGVFSSMYDFSQPIFGDLDLYANWTPSSGHVLVFDLEDDTLKVEVLDRRDPGLTGPTEAELLALIAPELLYNGVAVTEPVTYSITGLDAVDFRLLGDYQVQVVAKWEDSTGQAQQYEGALTIEVVDTTPPEIVSYDAYVQLSRGEIPSSVGYLYARARLVATDNYDDSLLITADFVDKTFDTIDWTLPNREYPANIVVTDKSGNTSEQIVIVFRTASENGGGGNSGGDPWDGGGDGDGGYVIIDDNGVPQGTYVQDENDDWVFIPEDEIPLTLPNTGGGSNLVPVLLAMGGLLTVGLWGEIASKRCNT